MTLFFKNYITRKYDDVIRDSHIPPIYRIIFHDKKGLHKQAPTLPGEIFIYNLQHKGFKC